MATMGKPHEQHNGARTPHRTRTRSFAKISRLSRELPRRIERELKTNPTALVGAVAGASFLLGALVGSKIGRLAIAAAIPYAVKHLFEGDVGNYVRGLLKEEHGEAEAPS
jgi:hypothetical protein